MEKEMVGATQWHIVLLQRGFPREQKIKRHWYSARFY